MVRIGLIGLGGFCANYHLSRLRERGDVEIAAICDPDPARRQAIDAPGFVDYRPLLELELDCTLVNSPNIFHFEQCRTAIELGLHVLVDKPLTMTADEASALVELSRAKKRILMTAYTRHFMASAQRVRADVTDVQAVTAVQRKNDDGRTALHGGILHARSVHILDLVPWLLQKPIVAVAARIDYAPAGHETRVDARLALKDGPEAHVLCISGDGQYQDEISIYARTQSFRLERERLYAMDRRGRWSLVDNLPRGGSSTDHFIDAVQGNIDPAASPTALDGRDGLQALRVVEAIKEAGRTGRIIDIPEI